MKTITKTNTPNKILTGLAVSTFLLAAFTGLPTKADPVLNLSNVSTAAFNRVAIDTPDTQPMELDSAQTDFIAALNDNLYQMQINRIASQRLEKVSVEKNAFLPENYRTPETKHTKLEFTSLNGFFISLTEQNRKDYLSSRYQFSTNVAHAGFDQPELSRANLLNSPFANLFVKKLTGTFSK